MRRSAAAFFIKNVGVEERALSAQILLQSPLEAVPAGSGDRYHVLLEAAQQSLLPSIAASVKTRVVLLSWRQEMKLSVFTKLGDAQQHGCEPQPAPRRDRPIAWFTMLPPDAARSVTGHQGWYHGILERTLLVPSGAHHFDVLVIDGDAWDL